MIPTERLQKGLEKFFGLKEFRPGQLEIVNSVMNGFDTLAVMPTGGGKSVCYQLPALLSDGLTIVITPLISLMKDQVAQINKNGLVATQLDSALELNEIQARLQLVKSKKVRLLYVAPERLESKKFTEALSKIKISFIAVDEAHCISQWGHDFRPHYTRIFDFAESIGNPTLLALTATATPDVQDDIVAQLKMRSPRVYIRGFARENLSFHVLVETSKTQSILNYVNQHKGSGIVYAATRKSVDEIHDLLNSKGTRALRYHAGLTERERTNSQTAFLNSDRVMVATNAFGMGINKPNVRYVIHYDIPGTLEAYYQEAGRAGRDGNLAECVLLFHKRDLAIQEYFIDTLYPGQDEFAKAYNSIFDSLSVPVNHNAQEYLTVSPQKIAELTKLNARTIDSVLRTLSQKGLIQFIPNISANAYVRSRVDIDAYRRAIQRTSSRDTKSILETLLRLHGSTIFADYQSVTLEEIARKSNLNASTVSRTLSILHRSGIIEYKPPSEGVSFKMLSKREDTGRLPIDFRQIALLRERAHERLELVVDYARTTSCRANFILDYFGAEELEDGCGNCDNCTIRHSYLDGSSERENFRSPQEIYQTILSLVKATGGRYGRTTCCGILLDSNSRKDLPAEVCKEYSGLFKELPAQVVYSAFDFLLSRKYISKSGLLYPTVSITEEGEDYLKTGMSKPTQKPFAFRKALYKALREERRNLAGELHMPVFTVCSNKSLIRIANERPASKSEITKCLPENSRHSATIAERILQVCLDFAPLKEIALSETERKVYELFLEKLTAAEISNALSTSVQEIIETLQDVKKRGVDLDLRELIDKDRFVLIKSELAKTGDIVAAHKAVRNCELAEVVLVSELLTSST